LLSDHAKAITGEVLYVDGGYNIMGAPDPALMEGKADADA
jgi:enoyl-[acyl-carrier-protein] reductase (NADH)